MLRAFFDESGHSAQKKGLVVSVGGSVYQDNTGSGFDDEWKTMLADFNVAQLHMRDFAHSRREFDGWTKGRQHQLLARALPLIARYALTHVGATIVLSEHQMLTEEERSGLIDPYYAAAQIVIRGAGLIAWNRSETVEVTFADHPEFRRIKDLYKACRDILDIGPHLARDVRVASPQAEPALQVADLVAYELTLEWRKSIESIGGPNHESRWPMRQLLDHDRMFDCLTYDEMKRRFSPFTTAFPTSPPASSDPSGANPCP